MKRRDVLRYAALATGAAVSTPLTSSILSGVASRFLKLKSGYAPQLFNTTQFEFLTALADTILPKTDSPSASEVGVPGTIDGVVFEVYPNKGQNYMRGFDALMSYLDKEAGNKRFAALDDTGKLKAITKLEGARNSATKRSYLEVKQQIISYYLSSEEIGENYLNYLPVPGYYDPCVTVESVGGKVWSL